MSYRNAFSAIIMTAALVFFSGCGKENKGANQSSSANKNVIANGGSDTMVNLAQMWAEEYRKIKPHVSVEVSGGGSGVGIRDLIQGMIQIANCSRDMEPTEIEQAKKNTGKDPVKTVVGFDAIALYVHKDNPINELTMEQLARIFGESGDISKWSQLGVDASKLNDKDDIIRVSRQNSSGTYLYFREHVLAKKDFKQGSLDMSGSKEVVELVASTKSAIGYSGMGYATKDVKMLKISSAGKDSVPPSIESVLKATYPLARSLDMYTLGAPEGEVKSYIDWILSAEGQKVVEQSGYVPVPDATGK